MLCFKPIEIPIREIVNYERYNSNIMPIDIIDIQGKGVCNTPQEVNINYGFGQAQEPDQLQRQWSSDQVNWHDTYMEGDQWERSRVGDEPWVVVPMFPATDAPESSDTGFVQV